MTDLSVDADFAALTDPYRRELLAHCYRMLGSIHDAEDLVQESYLRAWRGFDGFEGRSSVRVWLYKIATMACLTAIQARGRRALPSALTTASGDHEAPLAAARPAAAWLQPAPDRYFSESPDDPATVVQQRSGVRLAFIAALQYLPARQRAVLILRDVLAWRAAEVAVALDTSTAAVNSALQRARAQLLAAGADALTIAEPGDGPTRSLLDRYVAAFEHSDVDQLVGLLLTDVELEMPPIPTWFAGRHAVAGFLSTRVFGPAGSWRMLPTRANGQPAVVVYVKRPDHTFRAYGVQVLAVQGSRVRRISSFNDATLVTAFGFPDTLA